jgi:hypothetical protein
MQHAYQTTPTERSNAPQSLYLTQLSPGTVLDIETHNHAYKVEYLGYGAAWISGHPDICPEPRLVNILGSSSGGATLTTNFLGQGMQLEFQEPGSSEVTITSPIEGIHVRQCGNQSLLRRGLARLGRSKRDSSHLAPQDRPTVETDEGDRHRCEKVVKEAELG